MSLMQGIVPYLQLFCEHGRHAISSSITASAPRRQGPLMAVLHSRQWADILDDIALAVGGSVQYVLASPEAC